MSKKRLSLNIGFILSIAAAVLGVLAFLMMFADAAAVKGYGDEVVAKGTDIAFGWKETFSYAGQSYTSEYTKFNFLAFVTFILPLAAAALVIVFKFIKVENKILKLLPAIIFVVAAILFFAMGGLMTMCPAENVSFDGVDKVLKIGSIFGAIFCILGAAANAVQVFMFDNK